MKKAYLILSNGTVFDGYKIGADRESIGEVVFTTGMVDYLETLTDPSYAGQIVVQTFHLIGNYGVISEDFEGNCAVKGYVVKELCDGADVLIPGIMEHVEHVGGYSGILFSVYDQQTVGRL